MIRLTVLGLGFFRAWIVSVSRECRADLARCHGRGSNTNALQEAAAVYGFWLLICHLRSSHQDFLASARKRIRFLLDLDENPSNGANSPVKHGG